MAAMIYALVGMLILGAVVYDIARLCAPDEPRRPPLARLRGRRAALEAAELRLVGLRLHHRIDTTTYQQRMSGLARGRRRTAARPSTHLGEHRG
ncbi:hypothetical protein [Streptomyces milbemycinicus]|uniref:Uncharacterized protein n=1 Tax=Streptomyces milbemycinicus TaxID=476552 RepID=A0ABW8LMV7_9ACTN